MNDHIREKMADLRRENAKLIKDIAAERLRTIEECAQLCEKWGLQTTHPYDSAAYALAVRIRGLALSERARA